MKLILKYRNEITGLVFWVGMATISYYTIIMKKTYEVVRPTYLPVHLATAEGMKIGAPVRMLGVDYGFVSSMHYMELDESGWPIPWEPGAGPKSQYTPVGQTVIAIVDLVDHPLIFPDYEIFTRTERTLGPKGVDIYPGNSASDGADELKPLLLTAQERLTFITTGNLPVRDRILAAKNFDDPLFQIAVIMTENRDSLRRITYNSAAFTEKMNNGDGTVAALLNRDDLYAGANDVLQEAIYLTGDTRALLESLRESRQPTEFLEIFISLLFTAI